MRRNIDLIRKMILAIEDAPSGWAPALKFEGHSGEEIGYHAWLIVDAGLAKGQDFTTASGTGPEWHITALTWAGHEFADAARDDSRWKRAMGVVTEKGGTVTLAVLTQLLVTLMKTSLGLP